jgi:hypothetical protein
MIGMFGLAEIIDNFLEASKNRNKHRRKTNRKLKLLFQVSKK